MTAKEIIKVVENTLTQLEQRATTSLVNKDKETARMYMNYAEGVRMVLDEIEYAKQK